MESSKESSSLSVTGIVLPQINEMPERIKASPLKINKFYNRKDQTPNSKSNFSLQVKHKSTNNFRLEEMEIKVNREQINANQKRMLLGVV